MIYASMLQPSCSIQIVVVDRHNTLHCASRLQAEAGGRAAASSGGGTAGLRNQGSKSGHASAAAGSGTGNCCQTRRYRSPGNRRENAARTPPIHTSCFVRGGGCIPKSFIGMHSIIGTFFRVYHLAVAGSGGIAAGSGRRGYGHPAAAVGRRAGADRIVLHSPEVQNFSQGRQFGGDFSFSFVRNRC